MGFVVLVGIHQHWEVVNWEKSFFQANVKVQGMGFPSWGGITKGLTKREGYGLKGLTLGAYTLVL